MQNTKKYSKKERENILKAIHFAWTMAYIIVVPIVIFAIVGRLLDKHLNSSPLFILIGIFLAMIASMILLYKKVLPILNTKDKNNKYK